jgi:hypothetical protein
MRALRNEHYPFIDAGNGIHLCQRAKVIIELDSWEAGHYDGLLGRASQCSADLDWFSYLSGYNQARACSPELQEALRLRYAQRAVRRHAGSSRLIVI